MPTTDQSGPDASPGRTRRPPHRAALDADRLAAAALQIVDEHGLSALNARALAARLHVVPSALYKHLQGMDALVDLVVDQVLGQLDVEVPDDVTWQTQLEVLAHRLRAVLHARPGIASILKGRDPLGPNSDRLADAFARVLLRAGFTGPDAGHAWYTVVHYVIGFEATFATDSSNRDRAYDGDALAELHARFAQLDETELPALHDLGRYIWAPVLDERFAYGLGVMIEGLTARAPR